MPREIKISPKLRLGKGWLWQWQGLSTESTLIPKEIAGEGCWGDLFSVCRE